MEQFKNNNFTFNINDINFSIIEKDLEIIDTIFKEFIVLRILEKKLDRREDIYLEFKLCFAISREYVYNFFNSNYYSGINIYDIILYLKADISLYSIENYMKLEDINVYMVLNDRLLKTQNSIESSIKLLNFMDADKKEKQITKFRKYSRVKKWDSSYLDNNGDLVKFNKLDSEQQRFYER